MDTYSALKRALHTILEATSGFEPLNKAFAELSLTTWVCRRRLLFKNLFVKIQSNTTHNQLFTAAV